MPLKAPQVFYLIRTFISIIGRQKWIVGTKMYRYIHWLSSAMKQKHPRLLKLFVMCDGRTQLIKVVFRFKNDGLNYCKNYFKRYQ